MGLRGTVDDRTPSLRRIIAAGVALCAAATLLPSATDGAPATPAMRQRHVDSTVLTLSDWISAVDAETDGDFTAGLRVAGTGTVEADGSITFGAVRAVRHPAQPLSDAHDVTFVGPLVAGARKALAARLFAPGSHDVQPPERWDLALKRGWDGRDRGAEVLVAAHTGEVAAYLCGAGSWTACELVGAMVSKSAGELPTHLTFGVARDVIVDHPGQDESAGRFIALAMRRRSARTGDELADLVLRGESSPDPTAPSVGRSRVLDVEESAADVGAATALEVSLDAAWIAARRLAGLEAPFERYVAITSTPHGSPLQAGDRVLLLNGAPLGRGKFSSAAGDVGSNSVFTVVRDDATMEIPAADVDPEDVRVLEAGRTSVERPAMVVRSTTSGPSAGVVSTLAYLDAITPDDLTAGLTVAGSGTVTPHGYVGPVERIGPKTEAAVAAGADVLFAHPDNVAEATSAAPPSLPVIPIRSVREAVDWLGEQQPIS